YRSGRPAGCPPPPRRDDPHPRHPRPSVAHRHHAPAHPRHGHHPPHRLRRHQLGRLRPGRAPRRPGRPRPRHPPRRPPPRPRPPPARPDWFTTPGSAPAPGPAAMLLASFGHTNAGPHLGPTALPATILGALLFAAATTMALPIGRGWRIPAALPLTFAAIA